MTFVSSRTFNQAPSKVKAMADDGPVFVTDRGRPTLVVLTMDAYERLTGSGTLLDALRMEEDVEFEPVILRDLGRAADL